MLNRFTKSIVNSLRQKCEQPQREPKVRQNGGNTHPCASVQSRIQNPSITTVRSVFPWASDTVVTKLFSLTALFLNPVSTQDGTLSNGQVANCVDVRERVGPCESGTQHDGMGKIRIRVIRSLIGRKRQLAALEVQRNSRSRNIA